MRWDRWRCVSVGESMSTFHSSNIIDNRFSSLIPLKFPHGKHAPCNWPQDPIWIPLSICALFDLISKSPSIKSYGSPYMNKNWPSKKFLSLSPAASAPFSTALNSCQINCWACAQASVIGGCSGELQGATISVPSLKRSSGISLSRWNEATP